MKIIQDGNLKKIQMQYRFECRKCGCVFECMEDEVKKESGRYNEILVLYDCPTCGDKVCGKSNGGADRIG